MLAEAEPSRRYFWDFLIQADKDLFLWINTHFFHPSLDGLMIWLRTASSWYFFYILIVALVIWKWRWKSLKWIVALAILVALCDGISSQILKPLIGRVRPFNEEEIKDLCRFLLDYQPANESFPSSHATNHIGVALFFAKTFFQLFDSKYPRIIFYSLFLFWAASICFAQIYVGVHYPLDILGGGLLGFGIAYFHQKYFGSWVFKSVSFFQFKH